MAKIKLVKLEIDGSPRSLATEIKHHKYVEERGWGFNFLERTPRAITAKYIERLVSKETINDPYGDTKEIETIRYISTRFQLTSANNDPSGLILEVTSPPRSIRTLLQALSYCSDRVFASEVRIPLLLIYKELSAESTEARITRIRASKVPISRNSLAKVDINSNEDAYIDYLRTFNKTEEFIDKIEIDKPYGINSETLEITRTGLICCDEDGVQRTRDLILSKNFY